LQCRVNFIEIFYICDHSKKENQPRQMRHNERHYNYVACDVKYMLVTKPVLFSNEFTTWHIKLKQRDLKSHRTRSSKMET